VACLPVRKAEVAMIQGLAFSIGEGVIIALILVVLIAVLRKSSK
jgi:hypothetical protein